MKVNRFFERNWELQWKQCFMEFVNLRRGLLKVGMKCNWISGNLFNWFHDFNWMGLHELQFPGWLVINLNGFFWENAMQQQMNTNLFCSENHRQVCCRRPTGRSALSPISSVQRQGVHGSLVQKWCKNSNVQVNWFPSKLWRFFLTMLHFPVSMSEVNHCRQLGIGQLQRFSDPVPNSMQILIQRHWISK